MRSSLLDGVDLPRLRREARTPLDTLAVCLVDAGTLQVDRDDPGWPDRDRLVTAGGEVRSAVQRRLREQRLPSPDVVADSDGEALGLAVGVAAVSEAQGSPWRVWVVLADVSDDGLVWEAARAAALRPSLPLVALVAGTTSAPLWAGCGWQVRCAAGLVEVLAALDQALAAPPGVTAVLL